MASLARILLIDDDPQVCSAIERLLQKDFEVQIAYTLQKAQEIISEDPRFGILICDLKLPDGDGVEFLASMKERYPLATRVLLTAQVDTDALTRAINQAEIHRCIMKPWDNNIFVVQIHECYKFHQTLCHIQLLEILSTTDHLTGLINHRHMHETLQLELERASRHQRPLSFIMIDVDHFKKYNDTHGHPKGDRLLSDIAKFLAQSVRNIDIVARYGGEEFGIILPDTSLASAREIAERLRTQFHEKFEQTLSLGVSNYPDIEAEDVAQSLIDSADKALYSAKKNGRNQTIIAQKLV